MNTSELDQIFNTVGNVGGAVQDMSNLMQNRFGNNQGNAFDSRRNYTANQQQLNPYNYGYGYASQNTSNGMSNFYGNNNNQQSSGGWFNSMNPVRNDGYPGFFNPAYGGGMMR